MAQETIDYAAALLGQAKAKRAALDALIASLENAQAVGALGPIGEGALTSMGTGLGSGPAIELPVGALLGKSVSSAIRIYLEAIKRKQTAKEIAAGLKEGGVESTSKNFEVIVNNTLRLLKKSQIVLQFKDGWALAALYPESIRSRIAQQDNGKKPKKTKTRGKRFSVKAKTEAKTTPTTEAHRAPKPGTMAAIHDLLDADKSKSYTVSEIASQLGSGAVGLQLTLGKMAKAHKAEKCPDGRYRAFSGNVKEMAKAS